MRQVLDIIIYLSKLQYHSFSKDGKNVKIYSTKGTATPDHVIRTKGFPMLLTGAASFLSFSGSKEEAYEALGEFCAKILQNADFTSFVPEYHCWQRVWVANLQVFRDKACTVQRSQCAALRTSRNCTPIARDDWQLKVGAWN